MAVRKRMIAPTMWEDPGFNSLGKEARLVFIGMISHADDDGYIRADTGSIKRLIFGFDNETKEEVGKWVSEIQNKMKSVHFYEVFGEIYAHLSKWQKYQKLRYDRYVESIYPPCELCKKPERANIVSPTGGIREVKRSKEKRREEKTQKNKKKQILEEMRKDLKNKGILKK